MNNKKGQLNVGMIIVIIMGVIASIALFNAIADQNAIATKKAVVTDETFNLTTLGCYADGQVNESNSDCNLTVANAPSGWKVADCPLDSIVVTNGTGTALVSETDYNAFASSGVIQLLNTTDTESTNILVDYTYCRDGYNKDASSRSIANLNLLFTALAILAFVFIGISKEWFK